MFARIVTVHLKPNTVSEFSEVFEKQVVPMLRKQKGFQDGFAFAGQSRTEAIGISLWDTKENAENYARETYPVVLKTLENVLDGTPQVKIYEVVSSTFHKIANYATV